MECNGFDATHGGGGSVDGDEVSPFAQYSLVSYLFCDIDASIYSYMSIHIFTVGHVDVGWIHTQRISRFMKPVLDRRNKAHKPSLSLAFSLFIPDSFFNTVTATERERKKDTKNRQQQQYHYQQESIVCCCEDDDDDDRVVRGKRKAREKKSLRAE